MRAAARCPIIPKVGRDRSFAPWARTIALTATLVAFYYGLPLDGRGWIVGALLGVAASCALLPLSLRQVRRILSSHQPLAETIRTLVVVPTFVVLGFAATYYVLEAHNPGEMAGLSTKTDSLYFCLTMMSTVGFGDIHAEGQVARAVASGHMVVNLVLVGVVVQAVVWAARQRATDGERRILERKGPSRLTTGTGAASGLRRSRARGRTPPPWRRRPAPCCARRRRAGASS